MATRSTTTRAARARKTDAAAAAAPQGAGWRRWARRGALGVLALFVAILLVLRFWGPPVTPYMAAEARRLDGVNHRPVPMAEIAPVMARAAVAAEDADFCTHWGFDLTAIRAAIEDGGRRGASTISQQVTRNVFLWQGRSWPRKALEALLTPAIEAVWPKRRILEVYLNVAEFGEGVFGVEAAAQRAFGIGAAELSARQAAHLAAVLPSPKTRSAAAPDARLTRRALAIEDGAATIARDGRAACFQ